ncbi:DNA translocase FtsK, partial [Kurthia senegalensis]|uniref:DNA translocase FtsK n=1 Tax=Kurthia senegalensis TaxID=1033740 RepID=UPI000288CD8D
EATEQVDVEEVEEVTPIEEVITSDETVSIKEPTTIEGFMAQGLSKEEAEFRVLANSILKEKVRPFNVELLPSEKKKLQQQKNAEALTKLFPTSPMRPVITVNSYRKPSTSQAEQVHSPKSVTDEVSSFITPEAQQEDAIDIVDRVELVEEQPHAVLEQHEEVLYEAEFTQPFYEEESVVEVESASEGEAFHEVVQTAVEHEMTEQQAVINQTTAIALEERPEVVEDINNLKGQAPSQEALDLVFNSEPERRIEPNVEHALSYLEPPVAQREDFEWMDAQAERLVRALNDFQIEAEIEGVTQGPTVTQFQLKVGHGVKLNKITNLSDNLKLELAARDIRIEAPIPGKSLIGIEIPNEKTRPVRLSEITETEHYKEAESPLEVALGLGLTGDAVTFDLAKMPHGLIAGSTGSGKSVCINSILISLLLKTSPQDVKLMLIDPKMVELAVYEDIPHLVSPVITDVKAATAALKWAVEEMERRYTLFHELRVRHISRYNEMMEHKRAFAQKMPYLVIVIDELADLMMQAPQDVEDAICRITQKARACGIHLVVATQRPSVDVITGLIKSNIPTRIAFAVASNIDSRTILDTQGAERLLGKGDMLYLANGSNNPVRLQGTFVTDEEIEDVTDYVRSLGAPNYLFAPEELVKKADLNEKQDELFEAVCRHIVESDGASTSQLQRHFSIGYNRAARLMDTLEEMGYISEARGSKQRDVFLTETDLFEMFG